MELKVFAILDVKAGAYLQPMYFRRTEEALRSFSAAACNPDLDFYKYAEDYVLFEIGSYDDSTGLHKPLVSPISVLSASLASVKHKDYYAARALDAVA